MFTKLTQFVDNNESTVPFENESDHRVRSNVPLNFNFPKPFSQWSDIGPLGPLVYQLTVSMTHSMVSLKQPAIDVYRDAVSQTRHACYVMMN